MEGQEAAWKCQNSKAVRNLFEYLAFDSFEQMISDRKQKSLQKGIPVPLVLNGRDVIHSCEPYTERYPNGNRSEGTTNNH